MVNYFVTEIENKRIVVKKSAYRFTTEIQIRENQYY